MALHSLSEAARISGKSRSTIHRHIKDGKLSKVSGDDGKPAVETSELHRVYGSLSQGDTRKQQPMEQYETHAKRTAQGEVEALTTQLQMLERERDNLKQERDRWASQAERLTLLLTQAERPNTPTSAAASKGQVSWLDALNRWYRRL